MSINDLINSANAQASQAAAQSQAATQAAQGVTIEQAATTPETTTTTNFTPEQLAQAMALLQAQGVQVQTPTTGQQQAEVQVSEVVTQPQTTQVMAAVGSTALAGALDPELARFMVAGAPSVANTSVGMFAVDAWLKPSFAGMTINDITVKPFLAEIDLNEKAGVTPAVCMRYNVGETAQYIKSYDGQTTVDGMAWADAVRHAIALVGVEKLDRPYNSFDLVLRAKEDIVSLADGAVVVKAGTVLGHATPVTGTGNAVLMIEKAVSLGKARYEVENGKQVLRGETVTVKVSNEAKSKGSQRKWGILNYEIAE